MIASIQLECEASVEVRLVSSLEKHTREASSDGLDSMAFEQRKGNRIPLGGATGIIGMQMVSAVVNSQQSRGVARVLQDLVEIDHSIEFSAAAHPGVDFLTHAFFLGSIKSVRGRSEKRALERRVSGPNHSNSLLMGTRYELTIAGYHARGTYAFC